MGVEHDNIMYLPGFPRHRTGGGVGFGNYGSRSNIQPRRVSPSPAGENHWLEEQNLRGLK
jgi:hypothetical protein